MKLRREFFLRIWYLLCRYIFIILSDKVFIDFIRYIQCLRFKKKFYFLNLKNPKTFSEKLNYIKIFNHNKTYNFLADKILVREYVREKIGSKYLVPVLGIFSSANDIDFEKLPNKFILKTNHGSGWNLICKQKNKINKQKIVKKFNLWLSQNAFYLSREYQYKNIKTKLICEKLLGENIDDFKFFCFNGFPKLVQVDSGRFSHHKRMIYDMNFKKTKYRWGIYDLIDHCVDKPKNFDEMIELAIKLSKNIPFCRVDLYNCNNSIYFGEITLFPGGGQEPFHTYKDDLEFGKFLEI